MDIQKKMPAVALGTWSWGTGVFARTCRREEIILSTKFTPQIAQEAEHPMV